MPECKTFGSDYKNTLSSLFEHSHRGLLSTPYPQVIHNLCTEFSPALGIKIDPSGQNRFARTRGDHLIAPLLLIIWPRLSA